MKNFRVAWKNLDTDKTGFGRNELPEEQCKSLCEQLNSEYPNFEHVPAAVETAARPAFQSDPPPQRPVVLELTDSDPMPFGVHKGLRMAQVPSDYLDFIQGNNGLMAAWPQVEAYITRNRRSIDEDLANLERE